MAWYGADPGGIDNFGVAALHDNGTFETWCCSSVGEAIDHIRQPKAVGIDCPLWWTPAKGGSRKVDNWLRHTYDIHPGTVQSVNSLRGAVIAQGLLLALRLRKNDPQIQISETHPKALLATLNLRETPWLCIANWFGLHGDEPKRIHERDALLGAVAARKGDLGGWIDLAKEQRDENEFDLPFGPVSYWWPSPREIEKMRASERA
jgi:predicted nuclease with RNAse H fold